MTYVRLLLVFVTLCFVPGFALSSWAWPTDVMTVSGATLLQNSQPFVVHGFEFDAMVAPYDWLTTGNGGNPFTVYLNAYDYFRSISNPPNNSSPLPFPQQANAELQEAQSIGANTIEFKVSQAALDPNNNGASPIFPERVKYSAAYLDQIVTAVRLARNMGFAVILSMQDTQVSGGPLSPPCVGTSPMAGMPTAVTDDAAVNLANQFQTDRGVMFELYVEPHATSSATINDYINGGYDSTTNITYVGVNQIISDVRSTGSNNVIIVEMTGQDFSKYASCSNGTCSYSHGQITDSTGQLMFGLHPYFQFKNIGTTPADWDTFFGNFLANANVPMVVTEWNQTATQAPADPIWCSPTSYSTTSQTCDPNSPALGYGKDASLNTPLEFLHYLGDLTGINGVVEWAFDFPGTVFDEQYLGQNTTLTTMCNGGSCTAQCMHTGDPSYPNGNPGGIATWVGNYFAGNLPAVDGICGWPNGQTLTTAPSSSLCKGGTASTVSGSGPWTWSCTGSYGGATVQCSAAPAN